MGKSTVSCFFTYGVLRVQKLQFFYGQTLLFMSEIMQRLALASFKPEK